MKSGTSRWYTSNRNSLVAQTIKSACSGGEPVSVPGLGRSPGERYGKPLHYSCLENPMDRGPWQAIQSMGSQRVRHNKANSLHTSSTVYVNGSQVALAVENPPASAEQETQV